MEILAKNVGKLTEGASSIRSWATRGAEPTRANLALAKRIQRIIDKESSPSVSGLCEITRIAGGIEPWHLLLPDLDPSNPPQLESMVKGTFSAEVLQKVARLDPRARRIHENALRVHFGLEVLPEPKEPADADKPAPRNRRTG